MGISVALCTYNGEVHLPEQLRSIAEQSLLPEELVVCDDRSTDATQQIVRNFADSAPFAVRFEINPENLGSTRNFAKAIGFCQGETIALADQDDAWRKNKLERLAALMSDPSVGLVFSNAEVVDEQLQSLGYWLWDSLPQAAAIERTAAEDRLFQRLLRGNVVTGATMAFRARFKELVLPIPATWVHDEWIALLISAVAPCRAIAEPLIAYRQHSRQQIGAWRFSIPEAGRQLLRGGFRNTDLEGRARHLELRLEQIEREASLKLLPGRLEMLREKAAHFRGRASARQSLAARVPLILRELCKGRYHKYSLGWLTVARDLMAV